MIQNVKVTDFTKNIFRSEENTGVEDQLQNMINACSLLKNKIVTFDPNRRSGYVKKVNEIAESINKLVDYVTEHQV